MWLKLTKANETVPDVWINMSLVVRIYANETNSYTTIDFQDADHIQDNIVETPEQIFNMMEKKKNAAS